MNRLQSELRRLYLAPAALDPPADAQPLARMAMLELARPADWEAIATVWRGVQTELGLPAPAIAVSGIDGYQLWFSLAEPVPVAQAAAFVDALRSRYLGDVAARRVGLRPSGDRATPPPLPPFQTLDGQWSAFVAPDLAPVFADEPWLDLLPTPEGQADLLCRLACIKAADFQAALDRLGAATPAKPQEAPAPAAAHHSDPRRFLLQVMNDETVELSLRIEAAKALLPGFGPA
jgi:hypothetical protein